MEELDRLKFENAELREECKFLQKMLTNERRFFLEYFKHESVEEYRKILHVNREHEKGLHSATQVND